MLGQPIMRGLMLTVNNLLANAFVPVAVPIVLHRLEKEHQIPAEELGTINPAHPRFVEYHRDLQKVLDKQFGRLIGPQQDDALRLSDKAVSKKQRTSARSV